jgi:EAL domain-containing protein (putative c-di-GMP-specific phosphodiesterase class I)/GGDEF domain-containing protein
MRMNELWLYDRMSRGWRLGYRGKIMLLAFVGTHVPLIALVAYIVIHSDNDWRRYAGTFLVALAATLGGTAMTLLVLNHLLRPVMVTARTLRAYRATRNTGTLPTVYRDEVGTLMADTAATLEHLENLIDRIEHVDPATGLPNRRRLAIDTAARTAAGRDFALVAVRFGNFRQLAEATEPAIAERAVAMLANRLEDSIGEDTLYRVADEDFVILIETPEAEDEQPLDRRLRAMLAAASAILPVGPIELSPQMRAGVTFYPADGREADLLIDQAIAAAARGGVAGEAAIGFHSAEARATALARLTLEQQLRRALVAGEFALHYQPVIDVGRGRVMGAEALVRWQHPTRGLVMPAAFVPMAEEMGLIEAIDLWVLRDACLQLRDWHAQGFEEMGIAVNLSAGGFLNPHLIHQVREAVDVAGIAPSALQIELTESVAMADIDHSKQLFGRLRDLGVRIAIDDFGTGYASLSYLHRLPFDELKIDREFVSHVHAETGSQAICGALIALGQGLGLRLIAEGVESADEVRFLHQQGCNLFQGYYFSRPVAAETLVANMAILTRAATAVIPGNTTPTRSQR